MAKVSFNFFCSFIAFCWLFFRKDLNVRETTSIHLCSRYLYRMTLYNWNFGYHRTIFLVQVKLYLSRGVLSVSLSLGFKSDSFQFKMSVQYLFYCVTFYPWTFLFSFISYKTCVDIRCPFDQEYTGHWAKQASVYFHSLRTQNGKQYHLAARFEKRKK